MLGNFCRAGLILSLLGSLVTAQADGDAPDSFSGDQRIVLKYAQFDPTLGLPDVPVALRGDTDSSLWLVQFRGLPTDAGRKAVRDAGAQIHTYLPHNAYVVRMPGGVATRVEGLPEIRSVGRYEPAYRLEPFLLTELLSGAEVPERKYNIVVIDKRNDKPALGKSIEALGGKIVHEHDGSILFTVSLDMAGLLGAARLDQVLWIDRWAEIGYDMNNARIQGGGNYVETVGGYTGSGIRGHVFEGVEYNHPDFRWAMTNVLSSGTPHKHGHCTAGIVFGNGSSHTLGRGMAPDARGYYTYNGDFLTYAGSRNAVISRVVNTHDCMFTTASWGRGRTTSYTSYSADADDIVFDHRIPWTQSQSNVHTQLSRPEAWAKNVFSIGAVQHYNNWTSSDDSWRNGYASIGPAADGRVKPDLCAYYDATLTSDLTGSAGYSAGSYTTNFGGTSGATPIVAGHNALAIQMYTDGIFGNPMRVPGGSRFRNRPQAQTLKALMIASAKQYSFNSQSTDNLRQHQGWGFPDLKAMYLRRNKTLIVAEDDPLLQGQSANFSVLVAAGEPELKACMTFLDPMGNPASTLARINDLTLKVTAPNGTVYWGGNGLSSGNYSTSGGSANTIDTVENVFVQNPAAGVWTVRVSATQIAQDAHLATGASDATYALCVVGGTNVSGSGCAAYVPSNSPDTGNGNFIPFGALDSNVLTSTMTADNGGSIGGAVYFDMTTSKPIRIDQIGVNTSTTVGTAVTMDVYLTAVGTSYVGNEASAGAWSKVASASGMTSSSNSPSTMVLNSPLMLMPGSYGVALVARGFGHRYTGGTASNLAYNDATIALALGSASNVPFSGSIYKPRIANLEIGYVAFAPGSLKTTFASNNGGAVGGAVYFDLSVAKALKLSQIDINTSVGAGNAIGVDIYRTVVGSTAAGNETKTGAWQKVGSGTGVAAAQNSPSAIVFQSPISMVPGTYGIAVVAKGFAHRYTTGTGSNGSYSDSNIALNLGSASSLPFSGTIYRPRIANIDLHYFRSVALTQYANQRYQTIIRRDQLGESGHITGLAFSSVGAGVHTSKSLLIRMSHISRGAALANGFANNLPSPVTVLNARNHVWHLTGDDWDEIGLQSRFKYNGFSDLVIDVTVVGNSTVGAGSGFRIDRNTPRAYNYGWSGSVPALAGGRDNSGLKMRVEFGCASSATYGEGCGGLRLGMTGQAILGQSYSFDVSGAAPGKQVFLNLGFSNSGPLYPWNLSTFGFSGCSFYSDIVSTMNGIADGAGRSRFHLAAPNNPNLVGAKLYGQFVQLNASAPGGATFSGYGRAVYGHRP